MNGLPHLRRSVSDLRDVECPRSRPRPPAVAAVWCLLARGSCRRMSVASPLVAELLPEWEPFAAAVQARWPSAGTWCEAWTVRDIVVHQAGNAEELGRVLHGHLNGRPVATRSFEEREAPYRTLDDSDLWSALSGGYRLGRARRCHRVGCLRRREWVPVLLVDRPPIDHCDRHHRHAVHHPAPPGPRSDGDPPEAGRDAPFPTRG